MKKVKNTKEATVRQLQNISQNLREKFGKYSTAGVICISLYGSTTEYEIYVEHFDCTKTFGSWKELLLFYHKLIKDEI